MRAIKFIFKWGFFLSIWIAVLLTIVLFYYFQDLPSLSELEAQNSEQIIQINYSNEDRITNRGGIYLSEVQYYQLPRHLVNAVVATEDRRFFNHFGVDILGIARAFYVNQKAGRVVQGGSTITQQLAKMLFLHPERTIKRKIQEILLAIQLEKNFAKEQILTFYLNRAYFGSGNYGVAAAAKSYFGKDVSRLNLNESAMIAGLLKAPSKYSPKNNRDLAEERANIVLKSMIAAGVLDEDNIFELSQDPNYRSDRMQRMYFVDYIHDQFGEFISKKDAKENLVTINTTLDEKVQERIEIVLSRFIKRNSKRLGKSQISAIVMSRDGAVLGLIGGKDYQDSQFNRAFFAKRQAGSAFKTFVYLAAFEEGFKENDLIEDKRINIGAWIPGNYDNRYFGEVTLKEAFAKSLNSVSVQLAKKVGGKKIASVARKAGIVSKIKEKDLTISLGTTEITLLELVGAYATIANEGFPVIPYMIKEIRNKDDNLLYVRDSSGFDSIIFKDSHQMIINLMREVVLRGTGKAANIADNVYGKTGTSQNYRDAWFVGFDDEYVIGIWIGNDDNSATKKITGGSLPAQLFADILRGI